MAHDGVNKPLVLVCDDDDRRRPEWRDRLRDDPAIGDAFEIDVLDGPAFLATFAELQARRLSHGKRGDERPVDQYEPTRQQLDDAAVLVVDFDLRYFKSSGYLTGEDVCYLARCYSGVDAIVGVNQFGRNPFSLRLRDRLDSFADINVGEAQMFDPALWLGQGDGFHPWHWPVIANLPGLMDKRVDVLSGRLHETPLNVLELDANDLGLPAALLADLDPRERGHTLRDVAERTALGLRGGDRSDDGGLLRLLAARLGKWVDQRLAPSLTVVVDAPHLAADNALLLNDGYERPQAWEATTARDVSGESALLEETASALWEPWRVWASRPLWLRSGLARLEDLPGVRDPWDVPDVGSVFCEDLSRFLPRDRTREFGLADLPTGVPTRFVSDPRHPEVAERFPMLAEVDYTPDFLLST